MHGDLYWFCTSNVDCDLRVEVLLRVREESYVEGLQLICHDPSLRRCDCELFAFASHLEDGRHADLVLEMELLLFGFDADGNVVELNVFLLQKAL
jgi:hypothetical protein